MHANSFRHSITLYAKALFLCLAFSATTLKAAENSAGTVTFMLGKAFINGDSPIQVGSKIKAGDVIETLGNGHVHIRFVDNGLVSVRPDSRLFIEQYQFNAEKPTDSVIKFVLEEGIMRSISGAGAKAARDKFRLNTPIAAIGVRGTDFVVKSSENLLQAVVNEGAIAVAPFSDNCLAITTGPCTNNVVELTSDTEQFLEFSTLYNSPRLLPLSVAIPSISIDSEDIQVRESDSSQLDQSETNDDQNSTVSTSSKVNRSNAAKETSDANNTLLSEKAAIDSLLGNNNNQSTSTGSSTSSNSSIVNNPVVTENKLVWGRYSWSSSQSTDKVVYTRDIAKGSDRKVTIGNGEMALYRSPSERVTIDTSVGNVSFNLLASQATLDTGTKKVAMAVSDPSLTVDFTKGTFSTDITVSSSLTSKVLISGSGKINDEGFFYNQGSTIFGATTLEGDAASYYFSKDVDAGAIEGVTYWYR